MKVTLTASEVQYELNAETSERPIPLSQPSSLTVLIHDGWVQLTYDYLRSAPDGDNLARLEHDTGFWRVLEDLHAVDGHYLDGTPVDVASLDLTAMIFTDIIIEVSQEEA